MNAYDLKTHFQITLDRFLWIVEQVKETNLNADSQTLIIKMSENATRLHTIADALNGIVDDIKGGA